MIDVLWMIAQETAGAAGAAGTAGAAGAAQPQGGNPMPLFIGLGLALVVFYYMNWRGQKKDRERFESMLNSLSRNDRVQTVGGIYGTVVETRGQEVVLKIDETNNVKIRVNRNAIKEVANKQVQAETATAATMT